MLWSSFLILAKLAPIMWLHDAAHLAKLRGVKPHALPWSPTSLNPKDSAYGKSDRIRSGAPSLPLQSLRTAAMQQLFQVSSLTTESIDLGPSLS